MSIPEEHHFCDGGACFALLSSSRRKTSVPDKLHDHFTHLFIPQKFQQLVGKTTVLHTKTKIVFYLITKRNFSKKILSYTHGEWQSFERGVFDLNFENH